MKKLVCLFAMMVMFPIAAASAERLENLYQIERQFASQTEDLKEQAIHDGFLQVLTRLTGDAQITSNPLIRANLQRADYYVQDLSYSPVTTSSSEYTLRIQYDRDDVNRLLKKANLAIWSNTRPLVLVWLLVIDKQRNTQIINGESQGDIFGNISQQGQNLGLPLIFPMMDVEDLNLVSAADIGAMALPVLNEAAKRYSPDAMLIGEMDEGDTGWTSQWQLVYAGKHWGWRITDKMSPNVIAAIMGQTGRALSKNYVGPSGHA